MRRRKAVWLDKKITDHYSDYEYLIYTILFHGAPALAGMKTGTMLCFTRSGRDLLKTWDSCKDQVEADLHLAHSELRRCANGVTVLFYSPDLVEKRLMDPHVQAFLEPYGYQGLNRKQAMARIRDRFQDGCPHEIGIFLGYPLSDIIAFASGEHRGPCLMVGYWKVYGDLNNATKIFNAYDQVRLEATERLKNGVRPLSIVSELSAA